MNADKKAMALLYDTIEDWNEDTKKDVWERWLWGTDCNAKPLEQCWDMNESHILGILCIIRESISPIPEINMNIIEITNDDSNTKIIHLNGEKPIKEYSLREVLDQLECLQLNWGKIVSSIPQETSQHLLLALMARLGTIAQHAYELEGPVLDDPQHVTCIPSNEHYGEHDIVCNQLAIISRKSLRQSICILLVLFRIHIMLSRVLEVEDDNTEYKSMIVKTLKTHHIESSIDFFNHFQQMVYLAPGMRLVYRTNFAGMYNDVSQVIYFHFPRFARQPQIPLTEIPSSNCHMLPLLTQIMPDIPIFYDDDSDIPGLTSITDKIKREKYESLKWGWLVFCSEIFLLEINSITDSSLNKIYIATSRALVDLVAYFLKTSNRQIGDESIDVSGVDVVFKQGISMTAHGHLQMLET